MAKPLRIQFEGAVYHVTCRGNEKKDIFRQDDDRRRFLKILNQSLQIHTVNLHSFMLMTNHFHLLVETPLANLAEFMRHFNITYTSYFNRRHGRTGHLYQGRYKSVLVDKDSYLSILSRYIHLNPVRGRKEERGPVQKRWNELVAYEWSSLPGYLRSRKRESFVEYGLVLSEYGGDTSLGRGRYAKALYSDLGSGLEVKDKIVAQSICGEDEFVEIIREKYLRGERERERPAARQIKLYRAKEAVVRAIEEEAGMSLDKICEEKGVMRQVAMELLYRIAGMKAQEIGGLMGVGYTSVSQERRRLRSKLLPGSYPDRLAQRITAKCNK